MARTSKGTGDDRDKVSAQKQRTASAPKPLSPAPVPCQSDGNQGSPADQKWKRLEAIVTSRIESEESWLGVLRIHALRIQIVFGVLLVLAFSALFFTGRMDGMSWILTFMTILLTAYFVVLFLIQRVRECRYACEGLRVYIALRTEAEFLNAFKQLPCRVDLKDLVDSSRKVTQTPDGEADGTK
jgi:hypothetical protein